jgi:hypothetical protein
MARNAAAMSKMKNVNIIVMLLPPRARCSCAAFTRAGIRHGANSNINGGESESIEIMAK